MQMVNQGIISIPKEWEGALKFCLRCVGMDEEAVDITVENDKAIANIEEYYGDIEESLKDLVDMFVAADVPIDIDINYYGDYNGAYKVENDELICLDAEDLAVKKSNDDELIKELERRGYQVVKRKK